MTKLLPDEITLWDKPEQAHHVLCRIYAAGTDESTLAIFFWYVLPPITIAIEEVGPRDEYCRQKHK